MVMVMILVDFLVPVLMLLFGMALWKAPPDSVDKWYGYRTKRALKSQEAYVFAQIRIGKIWTAASVPLAALTLGLVLAFREHQEFETISLAVLAGQIVVMLLCMIPVEMALKKKYG